MGVKIAASVLASDFGRLTEEVGRAERGGADWIHVDVMDGHFVPNITMGPAVAAAVRRATTLPVDVHLMVEDPDRYLQAFAEAGVHHLTVHEEACVHLHRTVQRIRELGLRPGVALNPATPTDALREILPYVDMVLVMTVNPGFGGQSYISTMTRKVQGARTLADRLVPERDVEIAVDGGIDETMAGTVARAGATVLVAGSAVFRHPEGVEKGIRSLRDRAASPPAAGAASPT